MLSALKILAREGQWLLSSTNTIRFLLLMINQNSNKKEHRRQLNSQNVNTKPEADNNDTYRPVVDSGLGALYCLGHEVFGRWGPQAVKLLPELARDSCPSAWASREQRWSGALSSSAAWRISRAVRRQSSHLRSTSFWFAWNLLTIWRQ